MTLQLEVMIVIKYDNRVNTGDKSDNMGVTIRRMLPFVAVNVYQRCLNKFYKLAVVKFL